MSKVVDILKAEAEQAQFVYQTVEGLEKTIERMQNNWQESDYRVKNLLTEVLALLSNSQSFYPPLSMVEKIKKEIERL